mmetsp:Transcript_39781/g.120162  ORF Transcript_39781/g.120162 Transcript_39781/m.120162 type:complete len:355 (-) Transcript_39781:28-1092(-)
MRELLRHGIHLELAPVLQLELNAQNDAEQAKRVAPVADLLLPVDHADAPVVAHDAQARGVGVDEARVVCPAVDAVGHDAAQREEVAGRLRRQEKAEGPDLLVEVRLRPTCVHRRTLAPVGHVTKAELPLALGRVLREGYNERVLILAVGDDAAGGVTGPADADLVALRLGVRQHLPDVLLGLRHDPRGAGVEVVGPDLEGAPGHGVEDGTVWVGQLAVGEGRALEFRIAAPAATAGLRQRPVPESHLEATVRLQVAHAQAPVPITAIRRAIAVAIIVRPLPPVALQQYRLDGGPLHRREGASAVGTALSGHGGARGARSAKGRDQRRDRERRHGGATQSGARRHRPGLGHHAPK